MIKRMIIMLALCALFIGGLVGYKVFGNYMMMQYFASMGDAPQTVSTVIATKQEWQSTIKTVGTLRAAQGADLASEVSGTVEHIFINSGQDVTEGTILLQLNSEVETARLQALKAQVNLAEITVARDKKQLSVEAISQATYDTDQAQLDNLKAQLAEQKATLQKKIIVAPFSGRLGIRKVDIGQFLNAGETIVTVQQLDPIYLDFFVPQQKISSLKVGQKISLVSDSATGKIFKGEVKAINAIVDETTRNIEVRATFRNTNKELRPGMFASATLQKEEVKSHLTLPQTAITFNPYGNTVFVVHKDGKINEGKPRLIVKTAFVETGAKRGDQVTVLSGINEGDEIVTAGQLKLRNGSIVNINNKLQPSNDENPQPKDH